MQAGKKRHKITVQQVSLFSAGTYGGQAKLWVTFAQPWAEIRPSGGKKLMAAQAVQSKVDTEIVIRYLSGVLPKMRVSYNSVVYDIEAVINVNLKNEEMLLLCSTGVNEG